MRTVLVTLGALAIAASVGLAQAPDPAKVAAGEKIYTAQKCATCHSIAGKGGKTASKLDGVGAKLSEADIRKWLTNTAEMEAKVTPKPKVSMTTFMKSKKLSDADVDALTAYMMSLK